MLWIIGAIVLVLVIGAAFFYIYRIRPLQMTPPAPPPTAMETPTPAPPPPTTPDDRFFAIGNLVKDQPGMKAGVWFLSYEEAGASGLSVELVFTAESQCTMGQRTEACAQTRLVRGSRVEVIGNRSGSQVRVRTLRQLDLDQKG